MLPVLASLFSRDDSGQITYREIFVNIAYGLPFMELIGLEVAIQFLGDHLGYLAIDGRIHRSIVNHGDFLYLYFHPEMGFNKVKYFNKVDAFGSQVVHKRM